MMEYLVVKFRERRRAVVDGHYLGFTNDLIEIEAGRHDISVGPPYDFSPEEYQVTLHDTSVLTPCEVSFA